MKPKNTEELIAMLDDLERQAQRNKIPWETCVDKKAELINSYASLREKETAIDFELFLMKIYDDIDMNRESVEHAYGNWKKQQQ